MNHDLTGYKFSQSLEDLTHIQIQFLLICAQKHQELVDTAIGEYGAASNPSTSSNKLPTITDTDSPEVQRVKLDMIKAQLRSG